MLQGGEFAQAKETEAWTGRIDGKAYLLVGKSELVLQDSLVVNQSLNFIRKSIERLRQSLCEL